MIYQSFLKMQIDIFTYKMVNSCQLSSKVQVLADEGQFANAFLTRLPFLLWWSCEGHMHRLIRKGWVIFWCNEAIGMVIFDASTLPMVLYCPAKKSGFTDSVFEKSGHPKLLNPPMPRGFLVAIQLVIEPPIFVKLNPFFPSSNVKKSGEHDFWLVMIVEKFQ